jgi:hypothetical protein
VYALTFGAIQHDQVGLAASMLGNRPRALSTVRDVDDRGPIYG